VKPTPEDKKILVWRKSSHSGSGSGDCVELAASGDGLYVRDSKDPNGPWLVLCVDDWKDLADAIKGRNLGL
jgi:hypothetical protein